MNKEYYANIILIVFGLIFFYFFHVHNQEKRYEELNRLNYVNFQESCYIKIKEFKYSHGWTKVISTNNNSLLFSIIGLGDELNIGDSLKKEENSNVLNIVRQQEVVSLKIDYDKKLNPKINLD